MTVDVFGNLIISYNVWRYCRSKLGWLAIQARITRERNEHNFSASQHTMAHFDAAKLIRIGVYGWKKFALSYLDTHIIEIASTHSIDKRVGAHLATRMCTRTYHFLFISAYTLYHYCFILHLSHSSAKNIFERAEIVNKINVRTLCSIHYRVSSTYIEGRSILKNNTVISFYKRYEYRENGKWSRYSSSSIGVFFFFSYFSFHDWTKNISRAVPILRRYFVSPSIRKHRTSSLHRYLINRKQATCSRQRWNHIFVRPVARDTLVHLARSLRFEKRKILALPRIHQLGTSKR